MRFIKVENDIVEHQYRKAMQKCFFRILKVQFHCQMQKYIPVQNYVIIQWEVKWYFQFAACFFRLRHQHKLV